MRIQIVDRDDRPIGVKERTEIDPETDYYRVTALWLLNSRGEVLLARRALTKTHDPGVWGPSVAGTVEEGEDYDSNIYKEAAEELGVEGVEFKKGPHMYIGGTHKHFGQWYFGLVDRDISEFVVQEDEVAEIKWVSEDELKESVKEHPEQYLANIALSLEALSHRKILL